MAAPIDPAHFKDVVVYLATAAIAVPLFQRLKVSPVIGFILAGIVVGPFGLGALAAVWQPMGLLTIEDAKSVGVLAELGIVFLLFMIGLELSIEKLVTLRRLVFGLGGAQVGLSTAAIAAVAFALGETTAASVVIGMALALSSTAIVVPILAEQKRLSGTTGRKTFSILLFQDLMVAPILFIVAVLGARSEGSVVIGLALAIGQAVIALVVLYALGRLVLRPLFTLVAAAGSRESFMAACLLVVVTTGLATYAAGLSMALGAFIAGLLLGETEFRKEVEVTIEPFKGLLLGLFFMSIGMQLDLGRLVANPLTIALAVAILIIGKALIVFAVARFFTTSTPVRAEVALLTGPAGEFAFVVIASAAALGVVGAEVAGFVVVVATVSMILIPAIAAAAARLAQLLGRKVVAAPEPEPEGAADVVIVGFGRVGRMVADLCDAHNVSWFALDNDAVTVRGARREGKRIYLGDATRPELLAKCDLESVKVLVVTSHTVSAVERVVEAARKAAPGLSIVARARDEGHAASLYARGVNEAVPETFEASLHMSESALVAAGVPMGLVIASVHQHRDDARKRLYPSGAEATRLRPKIEAARLRLRRKAEPPPPPAG